MQRKRLIAAERFKLWEKILNPVFNPGRKFLIRENVFHLWGKFLIWKKSFIYRLSPIFKKVFISKKKF